MPKFKNSKSLVKFDGTKDFATGNVDLGQVRFNNPTQRAMEF